MTKHRFSKELLETDKSVPIHIKNLQFLATEMFGVYRNMFTSIMRQMFQLMNNDVEKMKFVRSVFCSS